MRFIVQSSSALVALVVSTWAVPARSQMPVTYQASPAPRNQHADSVTERPSAPKRWQKDWLLSLEAVTHAPIDMGAQLGVETPQGLRLFGGYGVVPGSYMGLLTGIAANASDNAYAQTLLNDARYRGHTWRVQVGLRPFRALGLYADVGYARLNARGDLDLAASSIPQLARLGGGYEASTALDMWLVELGYQGQIADRLVLGLALGCMGTFNATTTISAVNGAPTSNALLGDAASQADAALEKYGIVPTLTLRLGFDLI
jgi:hypothetical protein